MVESPILLEAAALSTGQRLKLRTSRFSEPMREKAEAAIWDDPQIGEVEWTGLGPRAALRWKRDGKTYSCSGLIEGLLAELGFPGVIVAGPEYWLIDEHTSLYDRALEIEPDRGASPESV